jgi:hypothetical protein
MKKLNVNVPLPQEDMPEEYKNLPKPKLERETNQINLKEHLSYLDFDKLAVLKSKIKSANASQKEDELKDVLSQVIDYLGDELEDHKKELCLYVMWKIERFILKPKQGAFKRSICVKVLAPLFNDNENNTGLYIDALMHEHKQIKSCGRILLRVFRYFTKNG